MPAMCVCGAAPPPPDAAPGRSYVHRCSSVALPCARLTLSMLRMSRRRWVMIADVASTSAVALSALSKGRTRAGCAGGWGGGEAKAAP